jgi:hypothetical protein
MSLDNKRRLICLKIIWYLTINKNHLSNNGSLHTPLKNKTAMFKNLLIALFIIFSTALFAQDQTINGHLYVGQGGFDPSGYSKAIFFNGNTDVCFIGQFYVAPNQTEFRFNMGDDLEAYDKFVVGVTWAGDGQWYSRMVVQGDGNVGIGTNTPQSKLDVNGGDIRASGNLIISTNNATGGGIKLADDGDIVDLNDGWATHRFSAGLRITNGNATGSTVIQLANGSHSSTYFNGGNVGIGTISPDAKLAVNGTIHSKEVKVDMNGWADYVFKPAYKLPSLTQVKKFIDQEGTYRGSFRGRGH